MFKPRTLLTLALIVAAYGLLLLPGIVWPSYLDTPVGLLVAIPFLTIYLFHKIGIPGLLENNGLCGWGWCAPTAFGWCFLVMFWLVVAWFIAWGLASLTNRTSAR